MSLPRSAPLTACSSGVSLEAAASTCVERARYSTAEERGGSWSWILGCKSGDTEGGKRFGSVAGSEMDGCMVGIS